MSALVRPVGGRACGTLSILKISSLRSAGTCSPVNGEYTGPPLSWPDPGPVPPLLPVSRKNPPASIANATAELTPVSSALRLIRTGHPSFDPEGITAGRRRSGAERAAEWYSAGMVRFFGLLTGEPR